MVNICGSSSQNWPLLGVLPGGVWSDEGRLLDERGDQVGDLLGER